MQVRAQLDELLAHMQEMLINDAALNAASLEELVDLAQRVEGVGSTDQRDDIIAAARNLTGTLKRALVAGSYTSVVARLDFWHRLIALKRIVRTHVR